jgi:hypothetical protein
MIFARKESNFKYAIRVECVPEYKVSAMKQKRLRDHHFTEITDCRSNTVRIFSAWTVSAEEGSFDEHESLHICLMLGQTACSQMPLFFHPLVDRLPKGQNLCQMSLCSHIYF